MDNTGIARCWKALTTARRFVEGELKVNRHAYLPGPKPSEEEEICDAVDHRRLE
jgi:hypothetical protein